MRKKLTISVDEKVYEGLYATVGDKTSKAMADQLATVSKLCLKNKVGMISAQSLLAVEQAIKVQLGL